MISSRPWPQGISYHLDGLKVQISAPVLVGRRKDYLWFPALMTLADGGLLCLGSAYKDTHVSSPYALGRFSSDYGLSWGEPFEVRNNGPAHLRLPGGDELILPYYLYQSGGDGAAPCNLAPKGQRRLQHVPSGVRVTGCPRPPRSFDASLNLWGFVFNGDALVLRDGRYLATLYGSFGDDQRYSLITASSSDGYQWTYHSTIAGADCPLPGHEGPCESSMCFLRDGRILSVFRLASWVSFGKSISADQGRTWSPAQPLPNAWSVEPSLVATKQGALALSGGRPGIHLWFDAAGSGDDFQRLDLQQHHNVFCPAEPIFHTDNQKFTQMNSSSYTKLTELPDGSLLCIYDRTPFGWNPVPGDSADQNSLWVVRISVDKT